MPHDGEVMGNKEIGKPTVTLEVLHEIQNLGLNGDIEGRRRLIADKKLRLCGKRPCNRDSLPLPTGELMRVLLLILCRQTDRRQEIPHLCREFSR
jgi:hypothetical protein